MKSKLITLLILLSLILASCSQKQSKLDLSGEWTVMIDSVLHPIILPGSLTENGIGKPIADSSTQMLSPQFTYEGKAVYEKEIIIPEHWIGKTVELYMERTKVSELYVNDSLIGKQNSVSTPHVFLMSNVFKQKNNRLKIVINNLASLLPLGGSHAVSVHTQTNWNGILGDFYLRCANDIDIRNVKIETASDGKAKLTLSTLNTTQEVSLVPQISFVIVDPSGKKVMEENISGQASAKESIIEHDLIIENPVLWDEYTPMLYTLIIKNEGIDVKNIQFGIRDFATRGTQFLNNERIVSLRGTHEGGVFPMTGYPSMKKGVWLKYFDVIKSYGLNHVRYHSWTPPAAAFAAADEKGVFLQSELPLWGSYSQQDTTLTNYMLGEGERIMTTYRNHPSLVMFALGNELGGDSTLMVKVVEKLKQVESKCLYALGSNNFYWDTQTHTIEDFFVSMRHGKEAPDNHTDLRGSFSFADSEEGGIINRLEPNSNRDFAQAIVGLNKPVIGHETGQYQTYPNFAEIKKYTGVMKPLNFEVFKERLTKKGMLHLSESFVKASGALSALCYREEIEMALRTPGFGGFQLLDLRDYPGQGTALVGILDVFMESKGVIDKEKWLAFCNDVVPLARFSKYAWSNNEEFAANIQIANYGQATLANQKVECVMQDEDGVVVFNHTFENKELLQGKLSDLGQITTPLSKIKRSQKMEFTIKTSDGKYANSWYIWVYAESADIEEIKEGIMGKGVLVTRDEKYAYTQAEKGNKVLYIPQHKDIRDRSVGGLFITDFWNYAVFKGIAERFKKEPSSGTLGLLIDNQHELFKLFPTDTHTNWQWWNIIKHSRPMILDNTANKTNIIVQAIDNFERNHRLGLIYEIETKGGDILVCSSDLFAIRDDVTAKALFHSMISFLEK